MTYRGVNALAESFNGLYKWELIHRQGPWRGLDDVEFATLTYVDWFNNRRLHGEITESPGYTTPAEHEAAFWAEANTRATLSSPQSPANAPAGMVTASTTTPTNGADTQ